MRISKAEEYGVRLVMTLAVEGGQLTIRELAEREKLPETTVAKIVGQLRRAGVVNAERGRNGGYELAGTADSVTLAQVVEAFDDHMFDAAFCDRMSPGHLQCSRASRCGLQPVWRSLSELVAGFLAGITVADIIRSTTPSGLVALEGLALAADRNQ